jgi:hypothetical protein
MHTVVFCISYQFMCNKGRVLHYESNATFANENVNDLALDSMTSVSNAVQTLHFRIKEDLETVWIFRQANIYQGCHCNSLDVSM